MKIFLRLFFILLACASCVHASFEFLNYRGRFVQHHYQAEKHAEIELPAFFFPINKPSEGDAPLKMENNKQKNPIEHRAKHAEETIPPGETAVPQPESVSRVPSLLTAVYLFASVCFILCLRGLSTPETSRRGNIVGIIGMAAAILVTFSEEGFDTHYLAFAAMVAPASVIGIYIAQYVSMVQMPQLVAMFHSFVGLAAMLVGLSDFHSPMISRSSEHLAHLIEIYVGEFVACITFAGSIVAACKLHEIMDPRGLRYPFRNVLNFLTVGFIAFFGILFCLATDFLTEAIALYVGVCLSLFLGTHLVAAIGGADMPVVISMLNSYSGFATAASGFMLDNNLLIIAGALIGSSGAILSYIMCRGMNRDFFNVMAGGWEDVHYADVDVAEGYLRKISSEAVADEMLKAKYIVIVPGYGMAVSRCQTELAEIAQMLRSRGIRVEFAIHPVAGRMPGHMNVLLAEADVPYECVKEMDVINDRMDQVDVALVVGANDIVNPAAFIEKSKIAGMPVIHVWNAKTVVVLKRSMATGYAGIDNSLFMNENTRMLFGDAKETTSDIQARIRQGISLLGISKAEIPELKEEIIEEVKVFPKPGVVIGILNESRYQCNLVAITPEYVYKLRKMAYDVIVESGAGLKANFTDEMYKDKGADVAKTRDYIITTSNIIVRPVIPTEGFIQQMRPRTSLLSYIWPSRFPSLVDAIVKAEITSFAFDEVPRITRAQKLDVRTSMSNLQGYRAVIEAFEVYPFISKAAITAAGKTEAAKVFVIGAGVAGLQAISTARSLGAVVYAHDTRRATKEEVESLGGKFVEVPVERMKGDEVHGYAIEMGVKYQEAQRNVYTNMLKECDIVICTASIPGRPSPKLISKDMIKVMKRGSVIVDLATEFGDTRGGWGGNCECSVADENVVVEGVSILGRNRIETRMPTQASELFAMNVFNFFDELGDGINFRINLDDEVIGAMCIVYRGERRWQLPTILERTEFSLTAPLTPPSVPPKPFAPVVTARYTEKARLEFIEQLIYSDEFFATCLLLAAALMALIGNVMDTLELQHLFLFVLALIVGYYCVWSVTPALHTPLMSVTNALSGVIIIGSMLEYDGSLNRLSAVFALFATFLSSLNVAGGFFVTKRMLDLFKI